MKVSHIPLMVGWVMSLMLKRDLGGEGQERKDKGREEEKKRGERKREEEEETRKVGGRENKKRDIERRKFGCFGNFQLGWELLGGDQHNYCFSSCKKNNNILYELFREWFN